MWFRRKKKTGTQFEDLGLKIGLRARGPKIEHRRSKTRDRRSGSKISGLEIVGDQRSEIEA